MSPLVALTEHDNALRVALTEEGWAQIAERRDDTDIREFLEHDRDNGLFDWIDPADIGAMTDAPILCLDVTYPDEIVLPAPGAPVYVYTQYMIRDPLEELEKHGYVDFVKFSAGHFDGDG